MLPIIWGSSQTGSCRWVISDSLIFTVLSTLDIVLVTIEHGKSGKPTAKEKEWYKKAYEWLCAGQEALKPGTTTAEVAKQFPDFKVYGLNSEEEVDGNAECHGVGLSQAEFPSIRRLYSIDNPVLIEEGMVFAVETWMGENFIGGCRVENVGVVRKEGFENLYTWPDDEMMVPYQWY